MSAVAAGNARRQGGPLENPDPETWGGFARARVVDNEDYERFEGHGFTGIVALPPEFDVVRIQNYDLTQEQLLQLAASPLVAGARYLDLRRNKRTPPEAFIAMLASGRLAHLEWLSLNACYDVEDSVIDAVVTHLPRLRGIEIGSTDVTDAGLLRLADLPTLETAVGRFMGAGVTEDGLRAFLTRRPDVDWYFSSRA